MRDYSLCSTRAIADRVERWHAGKGVWESVNRKNQVRHRHSVFEPLSNYSNLTLANDSSRKCTLICPKRFQATLELWLPPPPGGLQMFLKAKRSTGSEAGRPNTLTPCPDSGNLSSL